MARDTDKTSDSRSEEFVRLLKKHERRLNGYVLSLVHNWADADDIVQDVAVDLWRQFDAYHAGADFGAWACTIAYYRVLSHRKKVGREKLHFSEVSARLLAGEFAVLAKDVSGYEDFLGGCLDKLTELQRDFLRDYYSGISIAELSQRLGRNPASLYKNLSDLRHNLRVCIELAQRDEERRR